jgi:hypothetical protein
LGSGSLAANASYDETRADADPELFVPRVSRSGWSLGLALDQVVRAVQLSESVTYQRQSDAVDPDNDVGTVLASLRASGAPSERLRLEGGVDATRIDGGPLQGRTDTWTLSFQPAADLPAAWLSVGPYLAYTASENALFALDTTSETAQLRLTWSPPWRGSLLGLEIGTEWNRTRDASLPGDWATRYTMALTVGWGADGEHARRSPGEQIPAVDPLLMAAATEGPRLRAAPLRFDGNPTIASWR